MNESEIIIRTPRGEVKLTSEGIQNFWSKVERFEPSKCWPWMAGTLSNGYGYFRIPGTRILNCRFLAHRISWMISHGPIPDGLFACHSCDNPPCCNPDHIFIGTQKENISDMMAKGRHPWKPGAKRDPLIVPRGSSHGMSKLNEAQVQEIKTRLRSRKQTGNRSKFSGH